MRAHLALEVAALEALERRVQRRVHERRLAAAGHAGDDRDPVEGERDRQALEVVLARALDRDDALRVVRPPLTRNGDRLAAREVGACE